MILLTKIPEIFKNFQKKLFEIINILVSLLFYFLGIGLTRIISFVFNKHFLERSFTDSSWKKTKKTNLEKQY